MSSNSSLSDIYKTLTPKQAEAFHYVVGSQSLGLTTPYPDDVCATICELSLVQRKALAFFVAATPIEGEASAQEGYYVHGLRRKRSH